MIELRNLTLSYENVPILSAINYAFNPSSFTCVIGKNGCGKSTLLRAMAGLSGYNGHIVFNGAEISSLSRKNRAKCLSYLPQARPMAVMDVETLIAQGRYPHLGFSKTLTATDNEHIAYAISVTGVQKLLKRNLSTLSGGERQKAYIAMMLAQDADMLLLDEPTTHLDIEHQLEVMELLKKLHQAGKNMIMVAHDLPQALSYATHVILLAKGRLAAAGTPDHFCGNPLVQASFGVMLEKAEGSHALYSYQMTKGM